MPSAVQLRILNEEADDAEKRGDKDADRKRAAANEANDRAKRSATMNDFMRRKRS